MRKKNLFKLSVPKDIFEDILLLKTHVLKKQSTKYWKKELFEPKIIDDKIVYETKTLNRLIITNGLGDDKPFMIIECDNILFSKEEDTFIFYLGKVLEQKNTTIGENYKDNIIEQLLKEKELMQNDINKDYLTNIFNRRKLEYDLDVFTNQSNSSFLTSIFININRFKRINNNFGREVGDKVLSILGKKLQKHAKYLNGHAYRYEGDKFVILCFITKDELDNDLHELKKDIRSEVIYHEKEDITINVSIGVSFYSDSNSKIKMIYNAQELKSRI